MTSKNAPISNELMETVPVILFEIARLSEMFKNVNQGIWSKLSWASVAGRAEGARIWYGRGVSSVNVTLSVEAFQYAQKALIVVYNKVRKEMQKGNGSVYNEYYKEIYNHTVLAMKIIDRIIAHKKSIL